MAKNRQDWVTTARQKTILAIQEGRIKDAIAGVDAIWAEGRPIHDFYGDMCATFCDFIASELGEDGVERAWRYLGVCGRAPRDVLGSPVSPPPPQGRRRGAGRALRDVPALPWL
jgi:hypothetical protein